ncbi:hypothetical protein F5144DRAFT_137300 [Chaetomium tenue]|uniref:Uncharacterized protein n=1 Tax=Chaetomium tenue TaxID=1854479 RepID=A0ACB7PMF6_9PEZI|nr:hypothetical protein F5144DRAFT_137300 [Chaetomium globosum]
MQAKLNGRPVAWPGRPGGRPPTRSVGDQGDDTSLKLRITSSLPPQTTNNQFPPWKRRKIKIYGSIHPNPSPGGFTDLRAKPAKTRQSPPKTPACVGSHWRARRACMACRLTRLAEGHSPRHHRRIRARIRGCSCQQLPGLSQFRAGGSIRHFLKASTAHSRFKNLSELSSLLSNCLHKFPTVPTVPTTPTARTKIILPGRVPRLFLSFKSKQAFVWPASKRQALDARLASATRPAARLKLSPRGADPTF